MRDIFQIIWGEDISNTDYFISFKGRRRGELTFRKNPLFSPSVRKQKYNCNKCMLLVCVRCFTLGSADCL